MTIADVIRSMDDIELAQFFYDVVDSRDKVISESLAEQGVPNSLITMPTLGVAYHLGFLRRPAEDLFDLEKMEEERNRRADNG